MNVSQAAQNISMAIEKLSCHGKTPQQKPKKNPYFSVRESVTHVTRPARRVKALI
jgi:hypothetical protein